MLSAGSNRYLKVALLSVFFMVVVVFMVFTVFRLRVTYELQRDYAEHFAHHRRVEQWTEAALKQTEARLDRMERILFGDVIAQLEKKTPPPAWIELWQKNRDKELRDRIIALERRVWQLQQER
jgi:hypothetical protein